MSDWPVVEDPNVIFTGPSARGWHRLQVASECLQKYAWTYENGPREDISKKPPLAIGTLIHLALAQHYARMKLEQEGKNPNEYLDPCESVRLIAAIQGTERHIDNVVETYEAYRRTHWQDLNNRKIEGVEMLFDGRLEPSSPVEQLALCAQRDPDWNRLTGRVDLLFRDLGGRLIASDHKSTARLQRGHKEYFTVSGQMLGYEYICRQKHPDLAGFEINLIQHAGSKDPRFQRMMLPNRDALKGQFADRAIDIEMSIQRIKAENRPVDQWPKAMSELVCYTRYGACDYIHKCLMGQNACAGGGWKWED
jgi:hypothetical protein